MSGHVHDYRKVGEYTDKQGVRHVHYRCPCGDEYWT